MTHSWTGERLDDLNRRVEDGFRRVDADLRALRIETKTELTSLRSEMKGEIGSLRSEMKGEIGSLRSEMNIRFDALQRTMLQTSAVMIAALIGLIATQV